MNLLRNAWELPIRKVTGNRVARRSISRYLDPHVVAQRQLYGRRQLVPIKAGDGYVLSHGAGKDWMSFVLQFENTFQREKAQSALRPTVDVWKAMLITNQSQFADIGFSHSQFWHTAARDVDLKNSWLHGPILFQNRTTAANYLTLWSRLAKNSFSTL